MATTDGEPWTPHGLIELFHLEGCYQNAATKTDADGNLVPPRKSRTTMLFETLLNRLLFLEREYYVNSVIRPHADSETISEIGVSVVDFDYAASRRPVLFCFVAAAEDGPLDVPALEGRASSFCDEYASHNHLDKAHVCTLIGHAMRLWEYEKGVGVTPVWGGPGDGMAAYKDVGKEDDAREIKDCVDGMKATRV